jgi:hypothetical protein
MHCSISDESVILMQRNKFCSKTKITQIKWYLDKGEIKVHFLNILTLSNVRSNQFVCLQNKNGDTLKYISQLSANKWLFDKIQINNDYFFNILSYFWDSLVYNFGI